MRILSWNCQGARAEPTTRRIEEMHKMYSPSFMFLCETKNDRSFMEDKQTSLGYDNLFTVEPKGNNNDGGLALFYSNDYPVHILASDDHLIDTETVIDGNRVFMTFVYGDPVVKCRQYVWERLTRIGIARSDACWFIIGDFNEITGNHEKRGGKKRSENSFLPFRAMIQACGFIDFPFQGNQFSWKGQRTNGNIRSQLDRAMGNKEWHNIFPHTNVEYLKMWGSDHRPLLASIPSSLKKKFMLDKRRSGKAGLKEAMMEGWCVKGSHENHHPLSKKIQNSQRIISFGKKSTQTNAEKLIKELQNKIDETYEDILAPPETLLDLKLRLCDAYKEEGTFWF
ncbi:PREDICTED: uncharacterized protein LOC104715920 [Camelina sativa]|uniref:Uncharacterized protein LOC104715920 n=1 Tax=Camelina sativa TaxID=90675 RepID=A0ABM0TUD3_CAMSA|nr:PREDICTED: uncharacterized protein LOC104715920 [Camelina sativa]